MNPPGMRVLLIDDHALVRKGIEELLRSRGVQVVASASSGEEGIRLVSELEADIILLDIKMPRMTGIETLTRMRAAGVNTPVVMLTMSREEADLAAALRGGAQGLSTPMFLTPAPCSGSRKLWPEDSAGAIQCSGAISATMR